MIDFLTSFLMKRVEGVHYMLILGVGAESSESHDPSVEVLKCRSVLSG